MAAPAKINRQLKPTAKPIKTLFRMFFFSLAARNWSYPWSERAELHPLARKLPRDKQNVWKSCWKIGGSRLEWRGSHIQPSRAQFDCAPARGFINGGIRSYSDQNRSARRIVLRSHRAIV